MKAQQEKKLKSGLDQFGAWQKKLRAARDMDKFLTLVFLTAEEKIAFCREALGAENQRVAYIDGTQAKLTVVRGARMR